MYELSLRTMKPFLRWAVKGKTAPLQKIVEVPETKKEGCRRTKRILIIAITDAPLLQRADTKQVLQILRKPTAVHFHSASDELAQD